MSRHLARAQFGALALAASLLGGAAFAGDVARPTGVIELFTSQGCNSCPPADEAFADLAKKGDVVALAYHVNYWNYLGWRDTLSSKENTQRQYDYMRALGATSVYTPQAVINGAVHVNGANVDALKARLEPGSTADSLPVGIKVSTADDTVVIETEASNTPINKAHVVLVYYDAPRTVEINRGENAGRKVTYWNPVTEMQTAGMWHGGVERYELPASEIARKGGCAVLLQTVAEDGGPGKILGAAVVRQPGGQ
jgi:hypothetical protein